MIDLRPDDIELAVGLVQFARNALHAATLKFDYAGYACAALADQGRAY
ncbi:hypothetical protein [Mesorhizobium sp.]|nr:hypothetical protein [Mesorhizobium sp.]